MALTQLDRTNAPAGFSPLIYTPADGVNLAYNEAVAFIPTPDSPVGFDLDGIYYASFDAYRVTHLPTGALVSIRLIRQGETVGWMPLENVFKLDNAAERIPGSAVKG